MAGLQGAGPGNKPARTRLGEQGPGQRCFRGRVGAAGAAFGRPWGEGSSPWLGAQRGRPEAPTISSGGGPWGDSLEETQVVPRCGGLAAQAHVLKAHAGACGEDGAEGDKALRLRTMGPRGLDVRASSCEQRWVKLSGWDGNTGSSLSRWWGGR